MIYQRGLFTSQEKCFHIVCLCLFCSKDNVPSEKKIFIFIPSARYVPCIVKAIWKIWLILKCLIKYWTYVSWMYLDANFLTDRERQESVSDKGQIMIHYRLWWLTETQSVKECWYFLETEISKLINELSPELSRKGRHAANSCF